MARVVAGADGIVHLVDVLAGRAPRGRQTTAIVQMQDLPLLMRRPCVGGLPDVLMHGEIMDRRLVLQPGVEAHQIFVEEPQHFGQDVEIRSGAVAPGRDIGAGAMVPRTQ